MDEQASLPGGKNSTDALKVDSSCSTQTTAVSLSSNCQTNDDYLTPSPTAKLEGQEIPHSSGGNLECKINQAHVEDNSVPTTIQTMDTEEEQTFHPPIEDTQMKTNPSDIMTEQKESTTCAEDSVQHAVMEMPHIDYNLQEKQDGLAESLAIAAAESEEQIKALEPVAPKSNEQAMDVDTERASNDDIDQQGKQNEVGLTESLAVAAAESEEQIKALEPIAPKSNEPAMDVDTERASNDDIDQQGKQNEVGPTESLAVAAAESEDQIKALEPVAPKSNEPAMDVDTERASNDDIDQQGKQNEVGPTESLAVAAAESEDQIKALEPVAPKSNEQAMEVDTKVASNDDKQPDLGSTTCSANDDLVLEDTLLAGTIGSPDPEVSLSSLDSFPEKVDVRPQNSIEVSDDTSCLEISEKGKTPLIEGHEDLDQPEMKLTDRDDSPDIQLMLKDDSDYEMANEEENVCSLKSSKLSLLTEDNCEQVIDSLVPNTNGDSSHLNIEIAKLEAGCEVSETTNAMPDQEIHTMTSETEEADRKEENISENISDPDCNLPQTVTASQQEEMDMANRSKLQSVDFNISTVNNVLEVSPKPVDQSIEISDEASPMFKISETSDLKCMQMEISTVTVKSQIIGDKLESTSPNLPDLANLDTHKNLSNCVAGSETSPGKLAEENAALLTECEPPEVNRKCNPTVSQESMEIVPFSSDKNIALKSLQLEDGPSAIETNGDDVHTSTNSIEENVSPTCDPDLLQHCSPEKTPKENSVNRDEWSQLHSKLEEISAEFESTEFNSKTVENNLNIGDSQVHDSMECEGNFNTSDEAPDRERDSPGDKISHSRQDTSMEYEDDTDTCSKTVTEISSSDNQNIPQHDKFQTEKSILITNSERNFNFEANISPSHTKATSNLEVSQKEQSEDENNKSNALSLQAEDECNSDAVVKSYTKIIKIVTRDGKVCYLKIPANGASQKNVTNEVLLATRNQVEKELADSTEVVCKGCSKTLDKTAMHHECIDNFCRFCECQLQSREQFELHMFEKHVTLGVRNCPFCDLTLESMQILETHLQEHSTLRMAFSVCAGCRVQFRTREGRELHPCRADVSVCTKCNLVFKSNDLLLQHNNVQHKLPSTIPPSEVIPRYECDICDLLLPSEKKLLTHRQWHFDDCSSKLPQKQQPEEHDMIVLDENSEPEVPRSIDLTVMEQEKESRKSKDEEIPPEKCGDLCIQNDADEPGNVIGSEQLCAAEDTGATNIIEQNVMCKENVNELQDCESDTLQEIYVDQKDNPAQETDVGTLDNDLDESQTTKPDQAQDISSGTQLPESGNTHSDIPKQQLDVVQKECLATQEHQEPLDVEKSGAPKDQSKIAREEPVENMEVEVKTDLQNVSQDIFTEESKIVESELPQFGNQVLELPQNHFKDKPLSQKTETEEHIQDIKCDLSQVQVETINHGSDSLPNETKSAQDMTPGEFLSQSQAAANVLQSVVLLLSSDTTVNPTEDSPEAPQVKEQKCGIQHEANVDQFAPDENIEAPQSQNKMQDEVQNMELDILQGQTQEEKLNMFQDPSLDNSQDQLSDKKNVQADECCKHCSLAFESLASLYNHYNAVHFCKPCGLQLEGQSEFEQHMVEWHSTEKHCQFCCRTFRHGKDLKKHLQSHTLLEFKPITCVTCNTDFNKADFLKHNKCRNKAPSVLDLNISCDICKIFFQNEISRENHIIERHASTDSCPICDQTFFSSLELIEHVVAHNDVETTTFKCYACQFVSNTDKELDEHQCSVVSPEDSLEHEVCTFCKKIIFASESYESHLLEKHCNDNLCMLCDKDFESVDELKAHLNSHDSTEKESKIENSSEEIEDETLGEASSKVEVMTEVTEPVLLTYCHICKVRFVIRENFERHMMEEHSTDTECQFCNMKLVSPSILAIHLASHTKLPYKPYKCNKCGQAFSKESFVLFHACSYTCELCSKSFSDKDDLITHKKAAHTFQCDLCPREFECKAFLKMHLKVHRKVQQYCSRCKTKFKTAVELKDHDCITNKSEKQFECYICNRIYSRANYYYSHMQIHENSLKMKAGATLNTDSAPRTRTPQKSPVVMVKASPLSQKKLAAAKGKESSASQKRQPVLKPKENPIAEKKLLVSKAKQSPFTQKKLLVSKANEDPLPQKKLPVRSEQESPLPQQKPLNARMKGRVNTKATQSPKASTSQDSTTKPTPKLKVKLNISKWECRFCKLKCDSALQRKRHEADKHTCPICEERFGTPEATQKHLAGHYVVKTFRCEVCATYFDDSPSMMEHKCSPRQCQFCRKTVLNYPQLKKHLVQYHVPHLPCAFCSTTEPLKSPFLLSDHYMNHHKGDLLPFLTVKCASCGIQFYSEKHLMAHTCPPELLEQVRAKQQAPPLVASNFTEPSAEAVPSITDQFCIKEEPMDDWTLESSSEATGSSAHISLPTIKIEPNTDDYTPVFNPVIEASHLCLHCKQFFETPQILNEHLCKVQFCKFCKKRFHRKSAFELHMMTQHKMKNACQFCDRKFRKGSGLFQHLKTHTTIPVNATKKPAEPEKPIPQPLHPCKICKKNLNSEQLWEAHMMDNHSSEKECQFCDKTFQKNALLIRHLKSHTKLPYTFEVHKRSTEPETVANDLESTNKNFCKICNKKFAAKYFFDRHMISQHKSTSTCQFCGCVFHNLRVLLKHVKNHTAIEPQFECEHCKEVLNADEFGAHKCKPVEPVPYKKPVAPVQAVQSRKRSLSSNETESQPPKLTKEGPMFPTNVQQDSFKCLLCSKTFETDTARKRHLKLHHRVDAESLSQLEADVPLVSHADVAPKNPLTCNHCDMSFANLSELRHHAKEAQVYCDFCHCTLPSSMEYESHMLEMHSMGRTCQFCGAQFGNKAALSLHLRRHTSLKPIFFKCFHCGEKFHTELEKQNHPCKAWTCEVCDVRFPNEEALESHSCDEEQLLSDSECENCQSKFSSGQLLLQHMQVCKAPSASATISPIANASSNSKRKQDFKDQEVAKHQKLLDDSSSATLSDVSDNTPTQQPAKRGRPLKTAQKKPMTPQVVECQYCKKSFLTTEQYIAHCQDKHWFKCGVCGKKFEKENDMEQHLIWHRVNAIAQQYNPEHASPRPAASKTVLIRPISASIVAPPKGIPSGSVVGPSGPRVVKESLASVQTSHRPVAVPARTTHQGSITAFLCNTCGIYLSSSQALAQHKRSHMVFQCTQCSRVLSTARELAEHMQTHTVVSEDASSDDDDIAVLLEVKSQNPSATKPLEYGQFVLLD